MAAVVFDTLKFAERLREAGVSEAQTMAHVDALRGAMQDNFHELATKEDLKALEITTKRDIKELALSTRQDLKDLAGRLETKIDKFDHKFESKLEKTEIALNGKLTLLQWMMSFVLAANVGLIGLIIKALL